MATLEAEWQEIPQFKVIIKGATWIHLGHEHTPPFDIVMLGHPQMCWAEFIILLGHNILDTLYRTFRDSWVFVDMFLLCAETA